MITEINDFEQLLTQYESDRVLVGPLMSLPINASYRYFYLAGNGSKVYQSIGLGFLENESHGQKQRADIIQKLRARFAVLVLFDSHTEMARAVHTHWPTEETARVLTAAEREAKAPCAPQADDETTCEQGDEHTLRNGQSEQLAAQGLPKPHRSTRPVKQANPSDGPTVEEEQRPITVNQGDQVAAEPATGPFERAKLAGQESPKSQSYQKDLIFIDGFRELAGTLLNGGLDKPNQADGPAPTELMGKLQGSTGLSSQHAPTKAVGTKDANDSGPSKDQLSRELLEHTGRDDAGSIRLPPAATLPPPARECGEGPARQKHRDLGLTQDNIASAILKLASPAELANCPIPAVGPSRGLPEGPVILAAEHIPSHSESVPALPVKHTRGRSTVLRLAALVATVVLFWTFVPARTRQEVDQADNALLAEVLRSKSAPAVPLLPVSQPADTSGSAQQTEAAPRTVPPPAAAAPFRAENSDVNAPSVSPRHGDLSEAEEIAKPVSREIESLKSGDLESARLSLQRAVKAIPSPAAVPSQVDSSHSTGLPDTSQALPVKQSGPQNVHLPPIKSSPDAGQSAQVASLEPGVAPFGGHIAPAKEESTIRHLDPDEIAVLLSRGMDFLKSGDFASARVALQRAAEAGNAEAALALGSTYDPAVLRQLGAVTIAADVAQAREWYEKAVALGSTAAVQRLARLAQPAR